MVSNSVTAGQYIPTIVPDRPVENKLMDKGVEYA